MPLAFSNGLQTLLRDKDRNSSSKFYEDLLGFQQRCISANRFYDILHAYVTNYILYYSCYPRIRL